MTFSHTRANYHRILQYTLFWNRVDGNNVNILTNCRLQVHKENNYIFFLNTGMNHSQFVTGRHPLGPELHLVRTYGLQGVYSSDIPTVSSIYQSQRDTTALPDRLCEHTALPSLQCPVYVILPLIMIV